MAKNKSLKVLSTASVAGMVAAAVVSSQAFAAVDAYSVKVDNDVFQYSKADLTDSFLASKAGEAAPLYEDFLARFEKASGFYAFHDNKTEKYVSVADITEKYLEAKAAGTEFVVDTYTESKDAKVLEVPTVKKVVVKDGKVVIENEQVELKVDSVSAIKAKTLKVTFSTAVDKSKAVFEVKKGSMSVNVSKVTFADDAKSAELELATKLTKGDYIVTVKGVSEKDLTGTVTATDEVQSTIEVLSDKAGIVKDNLGVVTGAKVAYRVLNQYGEDVTKSSTTPAITWTSSVGAVDDDNNGALVFTGSYKIGDAVTVTGVMSSNGTVVTKTLTMSNEAAVDSVQVTKLYNADNKELNTGSTFSDFVLLLDAKDQYGNKINAAKFKSDMLVITSNPLVADVNVADAVDNQGEDSKSLGLPLRTPTTPMEGTANIRMISKSTGKTFTYDVTVKKAATVDSIALSNPTVVVATGETVEIPYTAADQYGNEVKTYTELNSNVTLSSTAGVGTVVWANDYVNKKGMIKFTAPVTKGTYAITAVTKTGKVSQITVDVKEAKVPSVVSQIKDVTTALGVGATTTISVDSLKNNVVVNDQYGRVYKLDNTFFASYKLKFELVDTVADKVSLWDGAANQTSALITTATGATSEVTLKGIEKGTEKIKVSVLKSDNTLIAGSEYEFTASTVAKSDITSYEVGDVATIFDDKATGYKRDLTVYGIKADGSKVVIPSNQYSVVSALTGVTYSAGELDANTVTFAANATETKGKIVVTIDTADGPVTVFKDITVSNVAAVPTTISFKTANESVAVVKDGVITIGATEVDTLSNLTATAVIKDQYGEVITPTVNVIFTNLSDAKTIAKGGTADLKVDNNGTATADVVGAEAGDTLNMTVVAGSQSASIKVVVQD